MYIMRNAFKFTFLNALFLALFCLILPASSYAQNTNIVSLKSEDTRNFIGNRMYITADDSGLLDAQTIAKRYLNNLRGKRSNHTAVNLNNNAPATWLVFSVYNATQTSQWYLSFGDPSQGRSALIKDLMIVNHTQDTLIFDSKTRAKSENKSKIHNLSHNIAPIEITPKEHLLFLIKVKSTGPYAGTITPSLIPEEVYVKELTKFNWPKAIFTLVMLLAIGYITALSISHKVYSYSIYSLYILFQILCATVLENSFLTEHGLIGDVLALIMIAALFTHWLTMPLFFKNTAYENTMMLGLVINGAICMIGFVTSLFVNDTALILKQSLIAVPMLLSISTGLIFSAIHSYHGRKSGVYLSFAWLCYFILCLTNIALIYDITSPNLFNIHINWLSLIPQVIFFIIALQKKIEYKTVQLEQDKARESRAEKSMARLQQAKENSDQARLLRVIERERELMTELREREILRTEEMSAAKTLADEANRAKSAFLAVVSHEVRTPMNGIMGMIRLLRNTQMTKQQNEYLQTMQSSGETMIALLNDILDFEKIESGKLELETISFDMTKLVRDVNTLMTGHAAEKEIYLKPEIDKNFPKTLKGDPTRIRQVLLNLVSNAIKFTDKGGVTITLTAKQLHSREDQEQKTTISNEYEQYKITCSVKDTGIGISKKAQQSLFQPFSQAEASTTRKYGGTGLGLTICKSLIENMEGHILLESVEGEGSSFTFTLNMEGYAAEYNEQEERARSAQKTTEIKPMNILVIEDNEMNLRVMKGFLEKENHYVTLRSSAEDALDLCSAQQFNVIITDINLGGMTGLEFTKNLRLFPNKRIAATPVLALSGNVGIQDRKECYEANLNGFLTKPIDPEKLNAMLLSFQEGDYEQEIIIPESRDDDEESGAFDQTQHEEKSPLEKSSHNIGKEEAATKKKTATFRSKPSKPQGSEETIDELKPTTQPEQKPKKHKDDDDEIPAAIKIANASAEDENEEDIKELKYETFDPMFLGALAGSLPAEQMQELLDGFNDTADQIITDLEALVESQDAQAINDKGHELKGMAANFGMTKLAEISGIIEKTAKDGDIETAIEEIKKLNEANEMSKKDVKSWLEESQNLST